MPEVKYCGSCDVSNLIPVLNLGERQPLAEHDNGRRYPLKLLRCPNCSLVQLSYIPDQREMFPPEHPYATGNTKALRDHFWLLGDKLLSCTSLGDLIVD